MQEVMSMSRLFALYMAACLVCLRITAMADDKELAKRPIRLGLEAASKTVKAGEVPKFKLTIRNAGNMPERIIDLSSGRRADLQDTYYDLVVTQMGKVVDIPRAISDPGPIGEKDFRNLKASEKVTFELSRFAAALEKLPPGKYKARVRFWQDPCQPATSAYFSPYAEFTVRE
jgi:hypothetical protein